MFVHYPPDFLPRVQTHIRPYRTVYAPIRACMCLSILGVKIRWSMYISSKKLFFFAAFERISHKKIIFNLFCEKNN